nr:hypothetical protein [Luteibacter rhizovicinus]
MDEQAPDVTVSPFTDTEKVWLPSCRELRRHETQPRRKVTRSSELPAITDRSDERRGGERTDAWNRLQAAGDIVSIRKAK